jgi:hypothetical protein
VTSHGNRSNLENLPDDPSTGVGLFAEDFGQYAMTMQIYFTTSYEQ